MGNKHIRQGLIALALAMQAFTSVSHAVSLPTQDLAVAGQAVLYRKASDISALKSNARQQDSQIDAATEDAYLVASREIANQLIADSQPVLSVTGVDLSPLPVSLPNQLRELSLAMPSGLSLDVGIPRQINYQFSNLVLDVRTLTLWGDAVVRSTSTTSEPGIITAQWTAVPLMTTGAVPNGADFQTAYASQLATDPVGIVFESSTLTVPSATQALWWPDTSTWDPNASVAALRAAGRSGVTGGPTADSAAIWLADLRLVPDFSVTKVSDRTGRTVGDMLITVNVQAIPEPGTLALWALGMSGLVLVARKAKG